MQDYTILLKAYANDGDINALTLLIKMLSPTLIGFLRGLLTTQADIDDVVQETWMRLIKHANSYKGGSVKALLITTARNIALDHLRHEKHLESLDTPLNTSNSTNNSTDENPTCLEQLESSSPSPAEILESSATARDIQNAIRMLPIEQRQVVLLRIEGELSFQEIAKTLNIPLGTTLTWMRQATQKLREIFSRS